MTQIAPKAPLDRLVAEARAQRPPAATEPGLPPRLRAEFRSWASGAGIAERGAVAGGGVAESRVVWSRWLLAAALLGGVALLLTRPGALLLGRPGAPSLERFSPEQPASLPTAASQGTSSQSAAYDGDTLALDVPLVTGDQPQSVQHGKRARWQLSPGSRARLLARGDVLLVALEHGSLEAQVEPSVQPESFVVRAQGTEVAVHGTRFRVSSSGERVHVQVSQGSVQVRPVGQSGGTVLRAQTRADFLAGAVLPASAPAGERPALPAEASNEAARAFQPSLAQAPPNSQPQPSAPLAAPPSSPGPATAESPHAAQPSAAPSSTQLAPASPAAPPAQGAAGERALLRVTDHVQSCFRRHLPGSRDLGIEVSTRLGLWVEASGKLLRADFDPPLAPAIEACVAAKLAQFRAAPSPEGYRVERDLLLHR